MDALVRHPLHGFPGLRTHDAEAFLARAADLFGVRTFDIPGRRARDVHVVLNHRRLRDIDIMYAGYGAPVVAVIDESQDFIQGLALRGSGDARADRASGTLSRGRGVVVGPGARLLLRYDENYEHLIARIGSDGLVRKLAALIGRPVDPPLRLTPVVEQGEAQLRLLEFLVGEIDRAGNAEPPLVLAELEQAVLVAFLLNSRHNYGRFLQDDVRQAAPWQVRQVEEYVRANWDRPLTIEALAEVAGTSARNLFHSFRKARGVSPMVFARQVRLAQARARLAAGGAGVSVTSVAFDCGFSNLGAFARFYRRSFGELPSATLRSSGGAATPAVSMAAV